MPTQLQKGATALDFSVTDINGIPFTLSDLKGKKIVLSFYRNVNCPFCNRRVHAIMGNNLKLQKSGVKLVLFFESSARKLSESVFHQGINPWPLVGDPEKHIYKKYGIETSQEKMKATFLYADPLKAQADTRSLNLPADPDATSALIPADFFIDENFKIVKAHYGQHLDDHVSLEEIKAFAGVS